MSCCDTNFCFLNENTTLFFTVNYLADIFFENVDVLISKFELQVSKLLKRLY